MAVMTATTSLILFGLLLLVIFPHSSLSIYADSNVLLTGETLYTELNTERFAFSIHDCNLVVYVYSNNTFSSKTFGAGVNCTLTLNERGQLVLKSGYDSKIVWETTAGPTGKYAAVLDYAGDVSVYGPQVWITPNSSSTKKEIDNVAEAFNNSSFYGRNVLFSSSFGIQQGNMLSALDYLFVVETGCVVRFIKATGNIVLWDSETAGKGDYCYLRLNHKGQLAILNDANTLLWVSNSPQEEGNYVFIVEKNGVAALYGPIIWSTANK